MRIPGPWRLLAALVFLSIVGSALATWLYAHRRMEAIRYIRSHGGSIDFADGHDGSRVPDWLRGIQSIHAEPGGSDLRKLAALSDATNLNLKRIQDDELQAIGRFRELERLVLIEAQVTGGGLRYVHACPRLRCVEIYASSNGDELLDALAGLPLTRLGLFDTPVTVAGMRQLAGMPLEGLQLYNADITDAGLKPLGGLRTLTQLSLCNSRVSDAGLRHLAGLSLIELKLEGADVTDAGLVYLKRMPLILLSLNRTQTTDAALAVLKSLPLQSLSLCNTRVTPQGIRELHGMREMGLFLTRPPFDEGDRTELEGQGFQVFLYDNNEG
jgi:hypothetical protein